MGTKMVKTLFGEVLEKEEFMLDMYSKIIGEIDNKKAIEELNGIIRDEKRHIKNAKNILKLMK